MAAAASCEIYYCFYSTSYLLTIFGFYKLFTQTNSHKLLLFIDEDIFSTKLGLISTIEIYELEIFYRQKLTNQKNFFLILFNITETFNTVYTFTF